MDSLTVSSSMLIPSATNVAITPAMLAVLWGLADDLDRRRVPATATDALWLEVPSKRLRDPDGRNDNFWLRECLDRLMGVQLRGVYRGDPWGAVVVAEYQLTQGGSMCRILVTPAAIRAIRAPETFAKIELTAAYKLKGHARRLYAALSDKKRMGNPFWSYPVTELRHIFGSEDKYPTWHDFSRYVLKPAIEEINDHGAVEIKATPIKEGRGIIGVRFDWRWKGHDEIRPADEEDQPRQPVQGNDEVRPAHEEGQPQQPAQGNEAPSNAPPLTRQAASVLINQPTQDAPGPQTPEERAAFANRVMREAGFKR